MDRQIKNSRILLNTELARLSIGLVLRNRRRYMPIVAVIAFGIGGLITILGVGDSVEKRIGEHVNILGECTIIEVECVDLNANHLAEFSEKDLEQLRRLPHVMEVAAITIKNGVRAHFGGSYMKVRLVGVSHHYWNTTRAYVNMGRQTNLSDEAAWANVCVLGSDVVRDLLKNGDPLNQRIFVDGLNIRVAWLLGGIQDSEMRRSVYLPITTAQLNYQFMRPIKRLRIRVDSWLNVASVREAVKDSLEQSLKGYKEGIRVHHHPERIRKAIHTVNLVKLMVMLGLWVVIVIGAVGLASLMSLAVISRTREVGLKKSLGATDKCIFVQFLTECIIVTVFGGLMGVGIGLVSGISLQIVVGLELSPRSVALAIPLMIILTVIIGVAAGLYPARRASRIEPAEALQFE